MVRECFLKFDCLLGVGRWVGVAGVVGVVGG